MKIGQSTIQFKTSLVKRPKKCTIADVPYWKLYSQPNDCIEKESGKRWSSYLPMTYQQIVKYLETFPDKRSLVAYPRWSMNTRNTYLYEYDAINNEFLVVNKEDGEVVYAINATTKEQEYLSLEYYKSSYHFYRKFFEKKRNGGITYLAYSLLNNKQ